MLSAGARYHDSASVSVSDLGPRGRWPRFVFVCRLSNARNKLNVILRRPRALARERLEGWPQARSVLPSFETVARFRERLPQDDVLFSVILRAFADPGTDGVAVAGGELLLAVRHARSEERRV